MYIIDSKRKSHFARQALAIFVITSSVVLVLELAESFAIISAITESVIRFTVISSLMAMLIYLSRHVALPTSAKMALTLCAALVVSHASVQLIEDIAYFDSLPIVGDKSPWKHMTAKVIIGGWTCSIFFLLYALIHTLERSNEQLQRRESELLSLNKELRTAKQQVIQSERLAAVGQLASGVAHELNNALSPVSIYAELLLDGETVSDQPLQAIGTGTEHALAVISQLQEFARTYNEPPEYQDIVNVSEIVRLAVQLTKPHWHDTAIKDGRSIRLETDLANDCMIAGDSTELKQVMMNLLFNAIEATDDGVIKVVTQVSGRHVQIDVIDDGKGMSPDQMAHCFEPFFSSKPFGTGLGLSVCYGIVAKHAGQLTVHQTSELGTTMRVRLPLATTIANTAASRSKVPSGAGQRILYVEDDEPVRDSTTALLESIGYVVDSCGSGHEGLTRLSRESYDMLLTDFGMSDVSGWDIVQMAKSRHPRLPVGVVSGWSSSEILRRFHQGHRPDFVLEKPLAKTQVAAAIASHIDLVQVR